MSYVVKNGLVMSLDQACGTLKDGAVAFENERITYVGPAEGAPEGEVIDAKGGIIMPGLVNCHTHASMTIMRGLADDLPLEEWLTQHIFPVEAGLTGDEVYAGAMLACLEWIKSGVTSFYDMYLFASEVARAAEDSGLRAVVGEVIYDFPSPSYGELDNGFALTRELIGRYAGHPRISATVQPHALYTCSRPLMERAAALAAELGADLNIHTAETAFEIAQVTEKWGKRPFEVLEELGLANEKLLMPHCVHLSQAEIERVAACGARIAHCPESNMKLASGAMPLDAMLKAGCIVGLGTDGAASNNDLDLFGEMDTCAKLAKVTTLDPTAGPACEVIRLATDLGARAAGFSDAGVLAPGKLADIIVVDTSAAHLCPMYSPESHLVYAARGGDVSHTICHGKVLMADRELTCLDQAEVIAKAREAASRLSGRELY